MRKAKVPLFKIRWDKRDISRVSGALKLGMHWSVGPSIEAFEDKLAKFIGTRYAVVFNSGTSALHAVMLAYQIGKGDEVIVPSFTFIATANAALFVGAKPIFADIEEEKFGLDPADIKRRITKRTKVILAVHYGGCPCDVREIAKIAKKHNIILIEDACEAFGANAADGRVGLFGDAAVFSFCQNKIITTGEGGCVVTSSKEICDRLKLLRSHGEIKDDLFRKDYKTLGFNFRMSNITASLGLSQMGKVNENISKRRSIAAYMTSLLEGVDGVTLPHMLYDQANIFQMYPVLVDEARRDDFIKYLYLNGIAAEIYFRPVHQVSAYRGIVSCGGKNLAVTERIASRIVCLPICPSLTRRDAACIARAIKEFFKKANR